MKCFCTPRPIEQTPTKLPVNIQSNNEKKHNVAYCRCIFVNHNIVHNKTNSKPILSEQTRSYLLRHSNSYDKKSFRNADVKKGFGKCFLISSDIENKLLANSSTIILTHHLVPLALVLCTPKEYR